MNINYIFNFKTLGIVSFFNRREHKLYSELFVKLFIFSTLASNLLDILSYRILPIYQYTRRIEA